MLIIVVYDISTADTAGKKRLNNARIICKNYGMQVQNSVFECDINFDLYEKLKYELTELIDPNYDSVIFYWIGHCWQRHVIRLGIQKTCDPYNTTIIL